MHAPARLRDVVLGIERDERVDDLAGRLRPIAAQLSRGTPGQVLRGEWLGHALHPLLTDLPLGCFLGAGLLDLAGGSANWRASQRLIGLGLLSAAPTAASGFVDWSPSSDERVVRVGTVHALGNTAMLAVYGASWLARRGGHTAVGVALGMVGGALGWATGYLGGHLSFNLGSGIGDRGLRDWRGRLVGTAAA